MSDERKKVATTAAAADSKPMTRLLQVLRASSKFFKWRVAVLVGWLGLSIVSVAAGLSAEDRNPLGATVHVREMLGDHWISVTNDSSDPWRNVKITLPGNWTYERHTLRPQDSILVPVTDFSRHGRDEDEQTPSDFRPHSVTVSTQAGSHEYLP